MRVTEEVTTSAGPALRRMCDEYHLQALWFFIRFLGEIHQPGMVSPHTPPRIDLLP